MAVNIKDVAQKAGVSPATVSKYLHGKKLKEKNQLAIEKAIKDLNFTVNEFARALRTHNSMTIGVLIPNLDNMFFTTIISYMENILTQYGYSTIICDCQLDADTEKKKLDFLLQKKVSGLIIIPYKLTNTTLEHLHLPIVLIDRIIETASVSAVIVDNRQISYEATEYLINKGHRKIASIHGLLDISTARERLAGYKQAMTDNGLNDFSSLIYAEDYDVQTGYKGIMKLMSENEGITAVIAYNKEIATGALMAIHELGLNIPEDISVVGFDCGDFAQAINPKLTYVCQPMDEIGRTAAQILLEKINAPLTPNKQIVLNTTMIEGGSVKNLL